MKRKKVAGLMMAMVMAVSLAACGGSGNSGNGGTESGDAGTESGDAGTESGDAGAESGDASDSNAGTESDGDSEEVTLTVLAGQSTTDAGIEDMIDEALAEKYPEITLEWECVDWGNDFQPKMQQYMQSGLPDIMIGKAQDVATYAPQGILGEIDTQYLDKGLDAARENVTIDGKTYGLVYNALYQGVYYNKAMFAENKWEVPKTQMILENSWEDAMQLEQIQSDSRFIQGEAAMYLTGSWSMQFASQYGDDMDFGIFPYPSQSGGAKLLRETNMTFMKSADTPYGEQIDQILYALLNDSSW